MKTVNQMSKLTGISVRALHYYDDIGLLKPAKTTETGYRMYGQEEMERIHQILLFRELKFPLKEIKRILESPDFNRKKAIEQQIEMLELEKERLESLIEYARDIKEKGDKKMDFKVFDKTKLDEYAKEAKKQWGDTAAYKEYEGKSKDWKEGDIVDKNQGLMEIFSEFGIIKEQEPSGEEAQALAKKLQDYITKNFYNCTNEIFAGLGQMYCAGGEFTENIDKAGGKGTAAFASKAIEIFCK